MRSRGERLAADLDWNALLAQLNLQGMARELAKNSVLESFSDGRVVLNLAPQHKHLQSNKIAQDKLQAALSDYFVNRSSWQWSWARRRMLRRPPPSSSRRNRRASSRQKRRSSRMRLCAKRRRSWVRK